MRSSVPPRKSGRASRAVGQTGAGAADPHHHQPPATDLGFLLHKHPDRAQSFPLSGGTAHVFYPRRTTSECTAALLLEVDPIGLVRGERGRFASPSTSTTGRTRPARCWPSRWARCSARRIAAAATPPRAGRPADPAADRTCPRCPRAAAPSSCAGCSSRWAGGRGDADPARPGVPGVGRLAVTSTCALTGTLRLADALNHLYVLLPVLDDAKHYWVGEDEVDKLLRAGEGWLAGHPERELISRRYLAHQRALRRVRAGPAGRGGRRAPADGRRAGHRRPTTESLADARAGRRARGADGGAAPGASWTWAAARGRCCATAGRGPRVRRDPRRRRVRARAATWPRSGSSGSRTAPRSRCGSRR